MLRLEQLPWLSGCLALALCVLPGDARGQTRRLPSTATSSAAGPSAPLRVPSPFRVLDPGIEHGVASVEADDDVRIALRSARHSGRPILLEGFPLPGGRTVDLELRHVSALADGARAVVMTESGPTWFEPTVVTLAGWVPGHRGTAFLALSPDMSNGFVEVDDESFLISSGGSTSSGRTTVASTLGFAPRLPSLKSSKVSGSSGGGGGRAETKGGWCGFFERPDDWQIVTELGPLLGGPALRRADVFVEASLAYTQMMGSVRAAADYAVALYTAASVIYRRDLGVELRIPDGYLRVWTTTEPWDPFVPDLYQEIASFMRYWLGDHPLADLPRTKVSVLAPGTLSGIATLGLHCPDGDRGYSVDHVQGFFPHPDYEHTSPDNADFVTITHETGHNFGTGHSFDTEFYQPPIECGDGTGPDNGTIMSYCFNEPGGIVNMGMRFHPRVQDTIRAFIAPLACLEAVTIERGDYDGDGILEATDLSVLDGYLAQTFESAGCAETFDMDQDGQVTSCDRWILAGAVQGPGRPMCFGYGANSCPCLNQGQACGGCDNPQATGGVNLDVTAFSPDLIGGGTAQLVGTGLAPFSTPTVLVLRSAALEAEPVAFGDGLRCVSADLVRMAATPALEGQSSHAISHGAGPGVFYYQLWYRSTPGAFCDPEAAFNLSNAYELVWP